MRDEESGINKTQLQCTRKTKSKDGKNVADSGCLSRIGLYFPDADPNCLYPGSQNLKEKYFKAQNSRKIIDKLYKISCVLFVPDTGSGC